jgi:hypothetical protein
VQRPILRVWLMRERSDLRSLRPTELESLQLPVMEFLSQRNTNAPSSPITCSATATLGEAVDLLAKARVHRVWVVVRLPPPPRQ